MQYAITVNINTIPPENANTREFVKKWVAKNHLEIQNMLASGFEITSVILHNSKVHHRLSASIILNQN